MALVACYTPKGEMKMKEPIDAKECVEYCGFTMEPPELETPIKQEVKKEITSEENQSGKRGRKSKKK